jgi:hypothetical protein
MADGILDQAKNLLQNQAGDLLKDPEKLKKEATEVGKKLTPDQYDDKVEGVVDSAIDFLKDKLGK